MNTPSFISHRLLVSAVIEHRTASSSVTRAKKPVIIDCGQELKVISDDDDHSTSALGATIARATVVSPAIRCAWPF